MVQKTRIWFPAKGGIFLFATVSRLAVGPNQPPIDWVSGALPWE